MVQAVFLLLALAPDVVDLKNGDRLVGEITSGKTTTPLWITTAAGPVAVTDTEIDRIVRRAELMTSFRRLRASIDEQPHRRFVLADWCLNHGLYEKFFDAVDEMTRREELPEHAMRLTDEAKTQALLEGLHPSQQWNLQDVEQLLRETAGNSPTRAAVASTWLKKLTSPSEDALGAGIRCLRDSDERVRTKAVEILAAWQHQDSLEPLIRTSLVDRDDTVRERALDAVLSFQHPNLVLPYIKALKSDQALHRMSAYPALEQLADPRALPMLMVLLAPRQVGHSGPPRNHIFVGEQRSFVQDFEVEIAQGAVIADPVVGVLQQGSLLDVKVAGIATTTVERHIVVGLLESISGMKLGDNYRAWRNWWQERGKDWATQKLLAERSPQTQTQS